MRGYKYIHYKTELICEMIAEKEEGEAHYVHPTTPTLLLLLLVLCRAWLTVQKRL